MTTHDPTDLAIYRVHTDSPEKTLLLAVLIDGYKDATQRKGHRREEARAWILSSNEQFLSFEMICDSLGLDPGYLRSGLSRGYIIDEQNRGIRSPANVRPTPKRVRRHVEHPH